MRLAPKLNMTQRQSLVMTPQLQQAIKLLQLSQIELAAFVEAELEQNPVLMQEGDGADENGEAAEATGAGDEIAMQRDAPAESAADDDRGDEPFDPREDGDMAVGRREWSDGGGHRAAQGDDDTYDPLQSVAEAPTLRDHVARQIGLEFPDPADRLIAIALADMLDAAGYLSGEVAVLAEQLKVPTARIEGILARLQHFDPPGIFARSLAECLALQLAERNRLDPAMQALLDNLPLLARRDVPALMRRCGVDATDLSEMVAELRRLDPKPGHRFDVPVTQNIVPDIFLRPAPSVGWLIELNNEALPRVLVNRQYYATLLRGARDKGAREFISERLQTANWLVKALDQRANTILRVAREIVRQQDGFFRQGVSGLRPLVLRDIAQAVELHESTISRVTTNKYIATPRGIFELKYFFTSAISGVAAGASVTAEAVRDRIRGMIESEPHGRPLSDDRIVELLEKEGVAIARRTVAKYRDALGIPSSAQRRRDKALAIPNGRRSPVAATGLRSQTGVLSEKWST